MCVCVCVFCFVLLLLLLLFYTYLTLNYYAVNFNLILHLTLTVCFKANFLLQDNKVSSYRSRYAVSGHSELSCSLSVPLPTGIFLLQVVTQGTLAARRSDRLQQQVCMLELRAG